MSQSKSRTGSETAGAPLLRVGPEPLALRLQLRLLIGESSAGAAEEVALALTARQWRRWRSELVPLGASAASFRKLGLGYRREIWLWAIGDRPWEQMMEGLVGRCLREFASDATDRGGRSRRRGSVTART